MLLLILFSLVINEVMYNPKGPESGTDSPGDRNEYIELYNESNDTVCIDGLYISDNTEKDSLIPFPDPYIYDFCDSCKISSFIPPGGYAVILDQDYLHNGEYFAPYKFGKGTILLSTYDTDLGNGLSSSDNIYLIKNNDTIDTYGTPYNQDNLPLVTPDGFSVERRNPYYPDNEKNWIISDSLTPGYRNTCSYPLNLTIDSVTLSSSIVHIQDTVHYTVFITNNGWEDIPYFQLQYITDDGKLEKFFINTPLSFLESTRISGTFLPVKRGLTQMLFYITPADSNPQDDTFPVYITVDIPQIVINEIMYNDTVEWIEITNISTTPITTGFKIKDRSGSTSSPTPTLTLFPDSFVVITGDSLFSYRFPQRPFYYVHGFPTLNNSYETVYLLSEKGVVFDSVHYSSSFGGTYGKSLEKINPILPSNERSSWKTCISPEGGTPDNRNSVYQELRGEKNRVYLSSHLIQYSLYKKITFTFAQNEGPIRFYLFNLEGKPFGLIHYENSPVGEWTWDGYINSHKLPTGPYVMYIEGKNFRQKEIIVIEE